MRGSSSTSVLGFLFSVLFSESPWKTGLVSGFIATCLGGGGEVRLMILFCIWKSQDLSKTSLVCYFRLAKCLVAGFLVSDVSARVSSPCLKSIDFGWLLVCFVCCC